MASSHQIVIRSSVAGRLRFEVPSLLDSPLVCAFLNHELPSEPGVLSISASAVTGRVLLTYERPFSPASLEAVVERVLKQAEHAIAAPAVNSPALCELPTPPHPLVQLHAHTRRHQGQIVLAMAVAFLNKLLESAPAAMIGSATDVVTGGSQAKFWTRLGFRTVRSQLFALGGVSLAVWSLTSLMGFLHRVTSARLAQSVKDDLRARLYDHLQTLDVGQLERQPAAHWTNLFGTEIDQVGQFIETGVDPLFTIVSNSLVVATTFLRNSPPLFVAQLIVIPGLYFISTYILGPIRQSHITAKNCSDQLAAALHVNVSGISTISVFGTQDQEAERIRTLSDTSRLAEVRRAELTAAYIPAIQMVVGLGFLSTLVYGGLLAQRGKLSIAAYHLMGFSSLRLLVALATLAAGLAQYQRTILSVERLLEFLKMRPALTDGPHELLPPHPAEISFEDVCFEYEPGQPVLRNLNLKIGAGRTTAIVGFTGAGKTTLVKLILRFYDVDSGVIRLDGVDIRDLKLENLRDMISLVPQQIFLNAGTVRENIMYAKADAPMEEVVLAAEAAHAHSFIESLPDGYDTRVGNNGKALSGGQQQRIAIARTILANRWILLFDEATSAIDYETEAAIQRALQEVMAERTTVIVAHRLSTVRHADWIYVLDKGVVVEEGNHEDLLRKRGLYSRLWKIQTGENPPVRGKNLKHAEA
jgi:ATP-binding cassette, subfamily B, bacterial